MRGGPTLRDVAESSGVSVCTASKALNDRPGVAAATADRIRTAAASLGYVPNAAARSLVSNRSTTIGFLVANAANRYHGELLGAVTRVVQERGYNIITGDSVDPEGVPQPRLERLFTESLARQRVAGIIAMGPVSPESLAAFHTWGTPIVFVDTDPGVDDSRVTVLPDNRAGGELVGHHFVDHGYRRVMLVGHAADWTSRLGREAGFRSGVGAGAELHLVEGGYGVRDARDAVRAALESERPPQAIFATNEAMLKGVLEALTSLDLEPGRDVAIASFDEFDWAASLRPAITTVDQHIGEQGLRAAALLMQMCDDPQSVAPSTIVIEPTLIVRDSCGDHRSAAA